MLLYMYASVFILYGAIDHKLISLVLSLMSEYHCGLYLLATHQVPLLWIGQLACIYDFIIKQKKKRLQLCFFLLIVCLPIMILGAVDQRPTNPSSKAKVIDWDKLQAQIEEEVIHQPSSFIFFRFCVLQISWKNKKKKKGTSLNFTNLHCLHFLPLKSFFVQSSSWFVMVCWNSGKRRGVERWCNYRCRHSEDYEQKNLWASSVSLSLTTMHYS